MPDLVPVDQAATEFRVGRNTLFRHLRNGRLKRYKGGIGDPKTYVDRQELKRLVKPKIARYPLSQTSSDCLFFHNAEQ